jgi:hypothetical protein
VFVEAAYGYLFEPDYIAGIVILLNVQLSEMF